MIKQIRIMLAGFALGGLALVPAAANADEDELEVTMEVIDSIADIDGDVIVVPGPEDDGAGRDGGEVGEAGDESAEDAVDDTVAERDFIDPGSEDGFTHDEDFEADEDEEHSERESDFDEGDDIDLDIPEEAPVEEEEPMADEEQTARLVGIFLRQVTALDGD